MGAARRTITVAMLFAAVGCSGGAPSLALGTVTGQLPICAGPFDPAPRTPFHARLRITASDGSVRFATVTARFRPGTFSLPLPAGWYRIHDMQLPSLPNPQVHVVSGQSSIIDLGFINCL